MFKLHDTYTFDAPVENIWPLIFDPASLVSVIPGCDALEQVSPDEYVGRMRVGIAAVGGTYDTRVTVLDLQEPHSCRMKGDVSGGAGTITGEATFELREVGEQTELTYDGKATITGALGTMSPRFIEGVVRTLVKQGLNKLNKQACEEVAAAAGE